MGGKFNDESSCSFDLDSNGIYPLDTMDLENNHKFHAIRRSVCGEPGVPNLSNLDDDFEKYRVRG